MTELWKYVTEFVQAINQDNVARLELLLRKHPRNVNDIDSHVRSRSWRAVKISTKYNYLVLFTGEVFGSGMGL
jgi:hypothetical protein